MAVVLGELWCGPHFVWVDEAQGYLSAQIKCTSRLPSVAAHAREVPPHRPLPANRLLTTCRKPSPQEANPAAPSGAVNHPHGISFTKRLLFARKIKVLCIPGVKRSPATLSLQVGLLPEHQVPRMHTGESMISNKVSSSSPWVKHLNPQGFKVSSFPPCLCNSWICRGHSSNIPSAPARPGTHVTKLSGLSAAGRAEWISPKERGDPIQIVPNVTATMSKPFTTKQLALQLCAAEDSLLLPDGSAFWLCWLSGSRWMISRGK